MNDKLNNNIQKIDILLNDEKELQKYINNIENTQISYSNVLENKILSTVSKKKSVYYANICKMVACMILAIILCQTDYIKSTNFNEKEKINHEIVQKETFLNEKINEISDFFMKPIEIEKGEK